MRRAALRRLAALALAVMLLGLGIALCLLAGLGSDAYTCLQQGLARRLGLGVGTVNLLLNAGVLAAFLALDRSLVGPGSVMMCLLTGPWIALFQSLLGGWVSPALPMGLRLAVTLAGIGCNAAAIAWYLPLCAGVQPMDMLVLTLARLCKKSYGFGMYLFSAAALAAAWVLGGTIGLGTLINLACMGALVDRLRPRLAPLSLAAAGAREPPRHQIPPN